MSTTTTPREELPGQDLKNERRDTKSHSDSSVNTVPDDAESRPLPAVAPDQENIRVSEKEHDGAVIPSEMDAEVVPLLGACHAAASSAMPTAQSGQLHRLMAHVSR